MQQVRPHMQHIKICIMQYHIYWEKVYFDFIFAYLSFQNIFHRRTEIR